VGLVATGALVLAACGSPPTTEGSGGGREPGAEKVSADDCPIDALEAADGPIEVQMWFGGLVEPPVTVLTDMVDAFNASQDDIVVTADNQGSAYVEVLRKYQGAAATPAQLPQIIYLEDTMLGEMVDKGQVLPAEACMLADGYDPEQLTAAARAAYSVDDVLYPGYMNVSTPVLYYNKVHFEQAGLDPEDPPGTLAEIEEAAAALKEAGVSQKPFSFKADQWFLSTWLAGAGVDVVNNDNGRSEPATEATFDTPEGLEILERLKGMNDDGLLNPFPVTDGSIDHYLALVTEESSMLVETSTASGTIAAALGGELTGADAGVEIDTSALDGKNIVPGSGGYPGLTAPGQIYASGGAFFILNTGSDAEQAASWEFLKFMLQPDNAKTWHIEGGYLPVLKELNGDADIEEFQKTDLSGNLLIAAVDQLATADPDRSGPLIGPYPAFQDITEGALENVLFSGADPAEALADAQAEATELFTDYNG
jgi:sn-glycerol 3-phosphate transport system substrate-binding protein